MAFDRRTTPSKLACLVVYSGSKDIQVKVSSPEESGHIMVDENVYFSNVIYKRRSSKLADENAKC